MRWRRAVWRPLSRKVKEIRVLILKPSSDSEADPRCDIVKASLTELRRFAALSYVWGDKSEQRLVYLAGHRIKVGKNAHTALRPGGRRQAILGRELGATRSDRKTKPRRVRSLECLQWRLSSCMAKRSNALSGSRVFDCDSQSIAGPFWDTATTEDWDSGFFLQVRTGDDCEARWCLRVPS